MEQNKIKILLPCRILSSLVVTISLVFLIMMVWWLLAPVTLAVVNVLAPLTSAQGNITVAIIRHIVTLWGVVAVVVILIYYGLSQAQRHDWRGEYA